MRDWRRHRAFNVLRGAAATIAGIGVLIMAGAAGTSDMDLSGLEQLILTLCAGIAVFASGVTAFCWLREWERHLREEERR